jgi:delta24-sterol reductase
MTLKQTHTTPETFKPKGLLEYLLTYHRGLVTTIFLLPLSVIYDLFIYVRNKIIFMIHSAASQHDKKVARVQQQIQQWAAEGRKEKLCTARPGWLAMSETVPKYKRTHRNISVNMYNILHIDEKRQIVKVEPLVSMGQITAALNPLGWTLPVVPELDDLTVGGLINGFGVESSSHKYGLFQFICESFEIVTADGKLLRCSKDENADLFYLIPWSHGTLGFLVAAELKIIRAKKYVRLQYTPVFGLKEICKAFEKASRNTSDHDFVEALLYGKDQAVLMTGTFSDSPTSNETINPIGRFYKPWFYQHVKTFLLNKQEAVEYIPLRHYYHRHTRSYFWEMEQIIPFGNKPLFRYLLGWAMPPKVSLLKMLQTETTRKLRDAFHIVQDMLVPVSCLEKSILYFHEHFNVYPLWLSPMAIYDNEQKMGFIHPLRLPDGSIDELFVDIGAYGSPQKRPFDGTQALRNLEAFVRENKGYQALYAKTLMTRDEFRQMFDHTDYDRIRELLPFCKMAFDEVYDKVSQKARTSPAQYMKMKKEEKK